MKFDRLLSAPRTDGNSQQVFFRRDETFDIVVRQVPPGPIGSATQVALQPDELLICDVLRGNGQTQIVAPDIDTSRRQAFIFARGDAVQVVSGGWTTLQPAVETVQASFDEVDAETADIAARTADHIARLFAKHGRSLAPELDAAARGVDVTGERPDRARASMSSNSALPAARPRIYTPVLNRGGLGGLPTIVPTMRSGALCGEPTASGL